MAYGQFQADAYTKGLWLMDEASGTNVVDSSGKSHNGTASGCTLAQNTGYFGAGWTFGASSNKITIPDHTDFTLTYSQSYTWEFLVKPSSVADYRDLFSHYYSAARYGILWIGKHTILGTTNAFALEWAYDASNKVWASTPSNSIAVGNWYYLAATYDAALAWANRIKLYINGVPAAILSGSNGSQNSINPGVMELGNTSSLSNEAFLGVYDMCRYSVGIARPVSEVRQEYAKLRGAIIVN